jgi:hypothetical protein
MGAGDAKADRHTGAERVLVMPYSYQPRRKPRRALPAVTLDRVPRERCICGKVPYASEGECKGVRRSMQRAELAGADRLRIYGCVQRHGVWHLGRGQAE